MSMHVVAFRTAALLAWSGPFAVAAQGAAAQSPAPLTHGPFLGDLRPDSVRLWMRAADAESLTVHLEPAGAGAAVPDVEVVPTPDSDFCVTVQVDGLAPNRRYVVEVFRRGEPAALPFGFETPPPDGAPQRVRLVWGSCAGEDDATGATWAAMARSRPHAVVLLGDTPAIDRLDLEAQRARQRAFAAFEPMARLLRTTPFYSTWDDRDFGRLGADGRIAGETQARRAFVEFRPNPSFGTGDTGIYTSFRRGPVEVFLLDARSFAATGPSPFRTHAASLLGRRQWEWLFAGLEASTAPFKVLATGMVWNEAVRRGKTDHWGSYPHEREALFRFLGEKRIGGVVLVGGDVRRSRLVRHAEAEVLAGYVVHELVTSPMDDLPAETSGAPHPGIVVDLAAPRAFLETTFDGLRRDPLLTARFLDAGDIELHRFETSASDLAPEGGKQK